MSKKNRLLHGTIGPESDLTFWDLCFVVVTCVREGEYVCDKEAIHYNAVLADEMVIEREKRQNDNGT